jgi:hypothetical protein
VLTLHFERRPLEPSIHTYSAMTLPFCSSFRYFWSCGCALAKARLRQSRVVLTLAVLEMIVDSA